MAERVRVWDPLVRVLHWSLAASIALAWFTQEGAGRWHEWIGYGSVAVVAVRIVYGWAGSAHARFGAFVCPPSVALSYAREVLARREPRYLGHNPLGGWMIVALLVNVLIVGASGWLYTTEKYWGVEWVIALHAVATNILLVLIALHVGGVALTSIRHGENLVAAMVHGRKRAPMPSDVI